MTEVQFVEINPLVSCYKELVVVYHIPSSIRASGKDYIALCEVGESSSQFTWVSVWAGKTLPLEQEGITIKWRKGKVTFASQVLPKFSDGREYFLMYCNEDGTILGESRRFQFFTDSDESSSMFLQNTYPEQRYTNTTELFAGDKDPQCLSQNVTSAVIPKATTTHAATEMLVDEENPQQKRSSLEFSGVSNLNKKFKKFKDVTNKKLPSSFGDVTSSSITITTQSEVQVECKRGEKVIMCGATRMVPLQYEWYKDDQCVSRDQVLELKYVNERDIGQYCCKITYGYDSIWSNPIIVKLKGGNKEHEVLIDNVDNLCKTLVDIDELISKFVTKRMITMEMAAIIRKAETLREKVQKLLEYITGPVEAGKVKVFYNLLDTMEKHGLEATQELAEEIRNQLNVKERIYHFTERLSNLKYQLRCGNLEQDERQQLKYKILEVEHHISLLKNPTAQREELYEATKDYIAEKDDEISFVKGDTILCTSNGEDSGSSRIMGRIKQTGERGMIPLSFVHQLTT